MSGIPFAWQLHGNTSRENEFSTCYQQEDVLKAEPTPHPESVEENVDIRDKDHPADTNSTSKPKLMTKKFGSFMGKLLLKSNSSKTIKKSTLKVLTEKTSLKQHTLTEERFVGLFRARKNRSDIIDRTLKCTADGIKFNLKSDNITHNNKYQIVNGRRTRWDIKSDSEQQKTDTDVVVEYSNNDSIGIIKDIDSVDNDDLSSVDSLQSDDNVLGPWIELGMVSPTSSQEHEAGECQVCLAQSNDDDRSPIDVLDICNTCMLGWNDLLMIFNDNVKNKTQTFEGSKINDVPVASIFKKSKKVRFSNCENESLVTKEPLDVNGAKIKSPLSSEKKAPSLCRNTTVANLPQKKHAKASIIPPIKSRHSQKTNRKIMASKKKQREDMAIIDRNKSKNAEPSTFKSTGAFMTRTTSKILADPEFGFYPNPHGFVRHQHVEVLNINGFWYRGTLELMDKGKVKVKYNDWDDQEEWIIMGSRRLRALSAEDEQEEITKAVDASERAISDNDSDAEEKLKNKNTGQDENTAIVIEEYTRPPSAIRSTSQNDDYVSSTLDKDPSQIFNNNEVFMTRKMARELMDEYGFRPNSFGYRRNRAVAITFHARQKSGNNKKVKQECVGYLREMHNNTQVRVWYPDLQQSEWIPVGSRRLRVLSEEEEEAILFNHKVDFDVQEIPSVATTQEKVLLKTPDKGKINEKGKLTEREDTRVHTDSQLPLESNLTSVQKLVLPDLLTPPVPINSMNLVSLDSTSDVQCSVSLLKKKGKSAEKSKSDQNPISVPIGTVQTKGKGRGRPKKTNESTSLAISTIDLESNKGPTELTAFGFSAPPISKPSAITSTSENKTAKPNVGSTIANNLEENDLDFLTTGAFATRRAMLQLKDPNGFTLNPYGYTYNLLVEILNTRSGKNKFWESGRLVGMKPGYVRVHYEGWDDAYDEWIMVGSRRIRIPKELNPNQQQEPDDQAYNCILVAESNPELQEEIKKKPRRHPLVRAEDYIELGLAEALIEEPQIEKPQIKTKKRNLEHYMTPKENQHKPHKDIVCYRVMKRKNPVASDDETEDYFDIGYENVNVNELEYDENLGIVKPRNYKNYKTTSNFQRKKSLAATHRCHPHQNKKEPQHDLFTTAHSFFTLPVVSLRLAQANAENKFVGNVHGYDYMQHVTVLQLDKKMYEGRLVSIDKNKVRVHYCGWLDAFDEYITLGSRRLQPIEHDHEVECVEPGYQKRYEEGPTETYAIEQPVDEEARQNFINRFSRRRLTLDDVNSDDSEENNLVEYYDDENSEDAPETDTWKVYCNQCNIVIKQYRYYCTYCETPSEGHDYQSFELCLRCFDHNFPFWHDHPRSGFAMQAVIDAEIGPRPIRGELVTVWEEDILEEISNQHEELTNEDSTDLSKIFTSAPIETDEGYTYLKKWKRRKVCAFCNDDDDTSEELGSFIGPFIIATFNKNNIEKKRSFWAHDGCARYSPEVFCTPEGKWYNVTLALRRGRGMKCHGCKEKGATIGCFESKCSKSFHLPCSQKPVSYFKSGVIFWCALHEAYYNKKDTYVNIFNCDGCDKKMEDESWFTCLSCASKEYFSSFDLCSDCFEQFPADHEHGEDDFEETSFAILKEVEAQKATEVARQKEELKVSNAIKKKKKPLFPRKKKNADGSLSISCCYCGTDESDNWRKGYDGGVIMCSACFDLALLIDNDGQPCSSAVDNNQTGDRQYIASIEDYSHKPYLTRDTLSATKFSQSLTGPRLASYEPQQNQLFSLNFDSTYFDIPGRAPRWASHSGTDYHGTWLPQTVRRAILKHTSKDERVLSNFLGRGTDAIECFLLQRRCCGVDINPAAVALSQRNCCFEIPPGLTSAEYRPIVAQADSRKLTGSLFQDESYHHILSHPPYKDCVAYSTHLEGDLSRFTCVEEFQLQYAKVVGESWRLLKMSRRLTLGIGDNREHCFYIPVSFHLMRLYIDQGFELEELIIKRQRYCSAFGLGTYLCVQFDFLVFTHEFIATFKKIPLGNIDRMMIEDSDDTDLVRLNTSTHGIPSSAITRKSVVMGTVWIFRPTETYEFRKLCISRMVERFGQDDGNWEHIEVEFITEQTRFAEDEIRGLAITQQAHTCQDDQQRLCTLTKSDNTSLMSEYEQQRVKRIQENNDTLLKLGLISELSEESNDVIHYETMTHKEAYTHGDLMLMVTGHRENILPCQINQYRKTILKIAKNSIAQLTNKGMLIIGTKDIRDSETGKLWPMTMLILEDIEREFGRDIIKLKEMVVTVPEGYSKDRRQELPTEEEEEEVDIETVDHGHVPIVHAIYLIFQKL